MRGLQISSQTYFRWWKQFWSYLSEVSYVSQILESHFWQESFPPTGAGGNAAKVRVQTQRCSLESSVFSGWQLDGRPWPDHAIRVDAPQQSRHLLAPVCALRRFVIARSTPPWCHRAPGLGPWSSNVAFFSQGYGSNMYQVTSPKVSVAPLLLGVLNNSGQFVLIFNHPSWIHVD